VDARPLDIEHLRAQGIGRYGHGLLGPLAEVAAERGSELVALREPAAGSAPFGAVAGARERALRRPPLPARAVELAEQVLLPLDLARTRARVHHALSIYRAPLVAPARVVVTVHDVAPLQWPSQYLRTGLVHRALYGAVRRAAAVVCVSSAARHDLLRHLEVRPERVHVVPEAAGERFRPTDPATARKRLGFDGPYLLYVGGLVHHDPRKDLAGLVDSFAEWSAEHEETLVLAGAKGPEADALAARAGGARVVLPGFVPEEELPALYSGAACFVTASRYEGFGLSALESLACGTPVAAYDAGAIPETAGPGALLAPPGDSAALMRNAGRICDEPDLRERLAGEGRRHASGFSWQRTAELTWDVYEAVA
jgi:glycosyltransferase involved in cell wall biosynthesis